MKIAQFSDLHYCPEHLDEADRCFAFAVEAAIQQNLDIAVISGDLFDHRLEVHEPAVSRLLAQVRKLSANMPVLILQGTFSHDQPGSLDVFKTIGGAYPVHVADTVQQVVYSAKCRYWRASSNPAVVMSPGFAFNDFGSVPEPSVLFSCLPPVNKGAIAAVAGADDAATAAGEYVYDLMKGFAVVNALANEAGIPTVVVSHGTVNGCITEHGVPMHGNDHEFSTGSLFASKAQAIMLGHIHQHQVWTDQLTGHVIAYPGSIGRLHFGEMTDKGFLIWGFDGSGGPEFITTPAKRLVQIEFDGAPDMDALAKQAADAKGAHVRVRWTVDEEHRDSIDKKAIEALFNEAGTIKLEGRIKPTQRQRSAGISQANTLNQKMFLWCENTDTPHEEIIERLLLLQASDPEALAAGIIERP